MSRQDQILRAVQRIDSRRRTELLAVQRQVERARRAVEPEPTEPSPPVYLWTIRVRRWGSRWVGGYGAQYEFYVTSETPTTVLAADRREVTKKVEAMYNARDISLGGYGSDEKCRSHDWVLVEVNEVGS